MSDVMQFIRELLEGKPTSVGVRGTVTHVVPVETKAPDDPALYLFQLDVGGYLYSDMGFTRAPELQDLQVGQEILAHRQEAEQEGHPLFLVLSPVPMEEEETKEVAPSDAFIDERIPTPEPFQADQRDGEREAAKIG